MILPTINLVARPNMVLPSDTWSFTRAGSAVSVNATGFLSLYPANTVRNEYSLGTSDYNGIVLETASTNLVYNTCRTVYSWTQSSTGSAVDAGTGTGLVDSAVATGTNTCTKVTIPATGTLTLTAASNKLTTSHATGKYTFSACVKVITMSRSVDVNLSLNGVEGGKKTVTYDSGKDWARVYSGLSLTSELSSASITITGTSGTVVYIDFVQIEVGNLTTPISGAATRPVESLSTIQSAAMGTKINNYEGTLFAVFKQSDNEANIANSIYPIVAITGTQQTCSIYRVTSSSTPVKSAIMAKSVVGTISEEFATQAQPTATGYFKVALRFGNQLNASLAINGAVYPITSGLGNAPLSIGTALENTPIIWVGSVPAITAFSVTDAAGNTYVRPETTTPVCLDGNILHFAYFPKALNNADLIAITS